MAKQSNKKKALSADEHRKKKKKRRIPLVDTVDIDLTPMIDCVFLLLIFFMCATKFKTIEDRFDVNMPNEGIATCPPPDLLLDPISIGILDSDEIARTSVDPEIKYNRSAEFIIDGRRSVKNDMDFVSILKNLPKDTPIHIYPVRARDTEIPFKEIVRVMDLCYMSGKSDIRFRNFQQQITH